MAGVTHQLKNKTDLFLVPMFCDYSSKNFSKSIAILVTLPMTDRLQPTNWSKDIVSLTELNQPAPDEETDSTPVDLLTVPSPLSTATPQASTFSVLRLSPVKWHTDTHTYFNITVTFCVTCLQ